MDKKSHTASPEEKGEAGFEGQQEKQEKKIPSQEVQKHQGKEDSKAPLPQGHKGEGKGISAEEKKEDRLSVLTDQLLRLQAEFDNYKKRTASEKERLSEQTEGKLMLRMLPLYEEIGLAAQEAQKIHDEALRKGILLVLGKLRSTFEKEGLQQMNVEGEKFDPYKHDAAMTEESELEEGTIVRCISPGYLFRGNVLRHALVAVSSGKKQETEGGGKEEKGRGEEQGKQVEKEEDWQE